jgi:hypothetical protein
MSRRGITGGGGNPAIGSTITGSTVGSVVFIGTSGILAQDNANLFWDDANNRLGIGTAAPATRRRRSYYARRSLTQRGSDFKTNYCECW